MRADAVPAEVGSGFLAPVQQTVACSSAESLYYSLCSGAAESFFVRALINELGLGIKRIHLSVDASAANAMSERTSVPTRAKHMSVSFLYLQQLVRTKDVIPMMTIVLTFSRKCQTRCARTSHVRVFVCSMGNEAEVPCRLCWFFETCVSIAREVSF